MRPHLLILHPVCISGKPRNVTVTEENYRSQILFHVGNAP